MENLATVNTTSKIEENSKISFSEKLIFGLGSFGGNLLIQVVGMYLMFFYTDVLKISIMTAGTLFLVARIVDSVVDFGIGYFIDHTKSRWGKFRPYVLFGFIPFCVLTVLCFVVPDFNDTQKIAYAYVTYLLLMVFTTVATLPCQAILPAMTRNQTERLKLNNYARFFGQTAMLVVAVGTMPLVDMFGKGNMAKGFLWVMIIFSSIAAVIFALWFLKIRERVVLKNEKKLVLKEAIPMIIKNKYLLLLIGTFVFFMSGFTIRNATKMYYVVYSLGRRDLIPMIGMLAMLPTTITILFVPAIVKKLSKKTTLMLGIIIQVVANICQHFVGLENLPMIYAFTVLAAIGGGLFVPLIWGMLPDTVDYAHWKFGYRTEGVLSATFIFLQKATSGIASYVVGLLLVVVGYIPNVVQSAATMNGISFVYNIVGALFGIVAIIFMFFYDLDEKKLQGMIDDLKKREAQE